MTLTGKRSTNTSTAGTEVALGVVTVTYNSGAVLGEFLRCVSRQDMDAAQVRLYAVDNASVDSSLEQLRAASGWCVMANTDNVGFAAACNQGIRLGLAEGCRRILLLNNDTSFGPDLFSSLIHEADRQAADALIPRIDRADAPGQIWFAGARLQRHLAFRPVPAERTRGTEARRITVDFGSGCALLIQAVAFDRVGLLDEDFFVYCEDVDFSIRLAKAGLEIVYAPAVRVSHRVGALTGGPNSAFSVRERMKNRVILVRKHAVSRVEWVTSMLFLQAWMMARLVSRRDSLRVVCEQERAFRSGFAAVLHQPEYPIP